MTGKPDNKLSERDIQLLKSARAQLNAIVDWPGAQIRLGDLYAEIIDQVAWIEGLLGVS